MAKLSEARKKANKKWNDNNKARMAYLNKRSSAKNFILKLATQEDLKAMEQYIEQRKKALEE